jgi:hypothetical protein
MTTTKRRRHPSPHARFPTATAAFDVPCAVDEALLHLHTVVRRSALSRVSEPGLVGRASREAVRVRWYSGTRAYDCDKLSGAIRSALQVASAR